LSESIHETLLGNVGLLDVSVDFVVNNGGNLEELSNGRYPEQPDLNQRDRGGRQPIAYHRLQTFNQSAVLVPQQHALLCR